VVCNLQSCLQIGNYAARNDAILLVIVPALQAPDVASSRALRIARELDPEGVYETLHKSGL
jgi:dynamin GTPase